MPRRPRAPRRDCASCQHFRPWEPGALYPHPGQGICSAMLHAFEVTRDSGCDCDLWTVRDLSVELRRMATRKGACT